MLYTLEQGATEKLIFERSIRYKLPLPDALKNAPSLFLGLEFYFNAFRELSTCRVLSMGIGNINYFMCDDYCLRNDICGDQRDDFISIIMAMDVEFLKFSNKDNPSKTKQGVQNGESA